MRELEELRGEIDAVDTQLCALLEQRMDIAREIGALKMRQGKPVLDQERELLVLASRVARVKNEAYTASVEEIFREIMAQSRAIQSTLQRTYDGGVRLCGTAVYQGVDGSFSSEAAAALFGSEIAPVATFEDVFCAVRDKRADYGVLPLENSSTGSITDVFDLLSRYELYIVAETDVAVRQCLLANHGATLESIDEVFSHEQGFFQSREFLKGRPWTQTALVNTAVAAQHVAERGGVTKAAIASARAGALYGLEVLKENINFAQGNRTRFIVLGREPVSEGGDKISILITLPHVSGSLYEALRIFKQCGLNLLKIESRPLIDKMGEYQFFIDLEGSVSERDMEEALRQIRQFASYYRFLGNYKKLG